MRDPAGFIIGPAFLLLRKDRDSMWLFVLLSHLPPVVLLTGEICLFLLSGLIILLVAWVPDAGKRIITFCSGLLATFAQLLHTMHISAGRQKHNKLPAQK